MEKHPLHIKSPELQNSEEVQKAVFKKERLTGEKIPNDPADRIEVYTDRLENIFLHPDEDTRKRNIEMFRDKIYDQLIIKKENFPESYFELQQRIARERGQVVEEIPQNVREQMMDVAIQDQKHSLDAWIDYLSSEDAVYPAWFKYFVWKNITKLSQFDKEKGEYKKRTQSTVAPYPDIYREPLAQISDLYQKVKEDNKTLKDEELQRIFSKKFSDLYAELTQKSLAASMEGRETIEGQWIKYSKGNSVDAIKLYGSLEGKGTGWCTAGKTTAKTQISSGDFYVFYTNDVKGEPTQPRLAIRMQGDNKIGEVRGILPHQAVEPQLQDILDEKLKDFGEEADKYKKKSEDMKMLTQIDNKVKDNPDTQLSKEELTFIYEINSSIEGFGYNRDPRIEEILGTRNSIEDASIIFDCTREQIATNKAEINENTKVYIGPLYPNIFKELPDTIEHVYTKFPDERIYIETIELSEQPKIAEEYEEELETNGMKLSDYAKDILYKADLKEGLNKTQRLIIPTVASLGFLSGATRAEIQARARELGIGNNLLPARVGPELRLKWKNQKSNEHVFIDMQPITDRDGDPIVFNVSRYSGDLWLRASDGNPGSRWPGANRWVFSQD